MHVHFWSNAILEIVVELLLLLKQKSIKNENWPNIFLIKCSIGQTYYLSGKIVNVSER